MTTNEQASTTTLAERGDPPREADTKKAKPKPRSRWRRRALIGAGVVAVGIPALWIAIHEIPGFGPALADGARWLFGPKAVAWAEDVSYGVQDRINQWRYKDQKPATFWDAPSAPSGAPIAPSPAPVADTPDAKAPPAGDLGFPPPPFKPPHEKIASTGEGQWIAVKDPVTGDRPALYKSLVHPDPKRSFAAVAVVAIDRRRVDLRLVAGSQEPTSTTVTKEKRPGVIPREVLGDLIAAFNGGFKAVHGHYGMMLDGDTYLPPRDIACTVALYKDGAMKIRTWSSIKGESEGMRFYRQTPPCLVEDGKVNTALEAVEYNKNWGATVSGETVIRRSAIGVDKTGQVLFYALGEAVTAQALSYAMKAVGAEYAAQLDVNYSYPRFLFYDRSAQGEAPKVASTIIPGIKHTKDEYVGEPSPRDFFYLIKKPSP